MPTKSCCIVEKLSGSVKIQDSCHGGTLNCCSK